MSQFFPENQSLPGLNPYEHAIALAHQGCYAEALAALNQAVSDSPDDYDAWTLRGMVLVCLGRYSDALESCDQALALRPNHREAWQFRGIALHGLNRYREAYVSYEQAQGGRRRSLLQRLWDKVWRPRFDGDRSPLERYCEPWEEPFHLELGWTSEG